LARSVAPVQSFFLKRRVFCVGPFLLAACGLPVFSSYEFALFCRAPKSLIRRALCSLRSGGRAGYAFKAFPSYNRFGFIHPCRARLLRSANFAAAHVDSSIVLILRNTFCRSLRPAVFRLRVVGGHASSLPCTLSVSFYACGRSFISSSAPHRVPVDEEQGRASHSF